MMVGVGIGIGVVVGVLVALLEGRRRSARAAADVQRRIGEELRGAATALGASCLEVPGAGSRPSSVPLVRGRGRGCAWTLKVLAPEPGSGEHGLLLEALHYGAHDSVRLEGPGLRALDLDPERLRAEVDALVERVERSA